MYTKIAALIVSVLALTLTSCAPPESPKEALYTVSYDGNGADAGTAPASVQVKEGTVITVASNPFTRSGHNWLGWEVWRAGAAENESVLDAGETFTVGKVAVTLKASWSAGAVVVGPAVKGK